jgi:hypothetical protein
MKLCVIVFWVSALVGVAGCAGSRSTGPGPNDERVCTSHGRNGCSHYDFKYPEDARSSFDKFKEESDRQQAYREGRSYSPPQYPGESFDQHFQRSVEETKRQEAYQKGESYSAPMGQGESFNHWVKRGREESERHDTFTKSQSAYGH